MGRGDSGVTAGAHRADKYPPRAHGPVLPGLLVVLALLGFIVVHDPAATRHRISEMIHGQTRIHPAVLAPQGRGHFALMDTQDDGSPVSYDPCNAVHYAINPVGAPEGYREMVESAVQEVARASGFEFAYDGLTDRNDFTGGGVYYTGRPAPPMLIGWPAASQMPALAGDVIGVGGSSAVGQDGRDRYLTGVVALDRDSFGNLARAGDVEEERAIVMHELAHVMGLAHVQDSGELMNEHNVGRTTFGLGDLEGLALLGAVACG